MLQQTLKAQWQVILCPYNSSFYQNSSVTFKSSYREVGTIASLGRWFFFPNVFSLKTNCAKLLIALLFFIKERTLYTQRNHLENIYIF